MNREILDQKAGEKQYDPVGRKWRHVSYLRWDGWYEKKKMGLVLSDESVDLEVSLEYIYITSWSLTTSTHHKP